MKTKFWFLALTLVTAATSTRAGVVINEIFYHAPAEFEELEWIELHNPDSQPANLSSWRIRKGAEFRFPVQTVIPSNGFLVICKNAKLFAEFYDVPVVGEFNKSLGNGGATVELIDAEGKKVDAVKFTDRDPWPSAADGYSSSLERITPGMAGDRPDNWAPSPLPEDEERPAGTPGRPNANYSANFPPVIRNFAVTPRHPSAGEVIKVNATVEDADSVETVEARYQLARPGGVESEQSVPMKTTDGKTFTAEIPAQKASQLVRVRVRALDTKKAERFFPAMHNLEPAISVFVQDQAEKLNLNLPLAYIIHTNPEEFAAMERLRLRSLRSNTSPIGNPEERQVREMLSQAPNPKDAWFEITINERPDHATYQRLRQIFTAKNAERRAILEEALASEDTALVLKSTPDRLKAMQDTLIDAVRKELRGEKGATFDKWLAEQAKLTQPDPTMILRRFMDIEAIWLALNTRFELSEAQLQAFRQVLQAAELERAKQIPAVRELIAGQRNFMKIRTALGEVEKNIEEGLRPSLSLRHHRFLEEWKSSQGSPIRPRFTEMPPRPARGRSAFVFLDQKTGQPEVFDFINITERSAGYRVHFHRDRPLKGMTSVNVIFEYNDRFVLAEPLAFELYRRVGNAACVTDFVRLTLNGHPMGYHLLFEQVNGSFLRRNHRNPDGDLYKILWYGSGVEAQHEKQNHPERDHSELVKLVQSLERTKEDEQWQVIQKHFNVEQVINYFAVNTVLSHWDGFFNNYFAYHDRTGTGKWEMYPWDQDKTWGFHDSIPNQVFFDMALTFGMQGDRPPGGGEPVVNPRHWWRPGGYFSKPLLANPEFRKRFLQRTRQILDDIYSEEKFFPVIDALGARLRPEIPIRAAARNEEPAKAMERFEGNIASLKEHLVKRRKFLLDQPELAAVAPAKPGAN
jgi:hypothetical protein